jgi:hypothetical protein
MSSRQKVVLFLALVAILGFLGSVETASAQCAMCVTALEQNGGKIAGGFNRAILFLLVMPYLVFGSIALVWYWKHHKAGAAVRAEGGAANPILLGQTGS